MSYSVIIPAYNEEQFLPDTLRALDAAMSELGEKGQVIVVDNNSTDATARVAEEHGAEVVFEPVNQISRARNAGVAVAGGKHLIFVDADTRVTAELLRTALGNLESGTCCGGGALVTFDRSSRFADWLLRIWTWFSLKLRLAAGSFVYCLREGFDAVGGFSQSVYASEEIWFSRDLKAWGRKRGLDFRIIETAPVVTSLRKLDWYSPFSMLLLLLLFTVFPLAPRFRSLCGHWYKRPKTGSSPGSRTTETRAE